MNIYLALSICIKIVLDLLHKMCAKESPLIKKSVKPHNDNRRFYFVKYYLGNGTRAEKEK